MGDDACTAGTHRLPSGRRLGYAEFGDPAGRPLFYFNGSPGSRLEGELLSASAQSRGVRVIAVDRPGFGRSDPEPARRLADWPHDISALADALGLERFAVLGASGGGPYAAACAALIPDRLRAAGILCGVAPFRVPEPDRMPMPPAARPLFALVRRAPWIGLLAMAPLIALLRHRPAIALRGMARFLPEPDRAVLEREDVRRVLLHSLREALRQGSRPAGTEFLLYARPWGFRLEDIRIPVHLWQGELDRSVPPEMAHHQARAIPDARLTLYDDEGHLSIGVNRIDEILDTLTAASRGPEA